MRRFAVCVLILSASAAKAEGIDRDTLLTDAPAAPAAGTLRATAGAAATDSSDSSQTSVSGSLSWTPVANLTADVGAYAQSGAQGPSARIRYQLLDQARFGIDLSLGVRFKTVGFHPNQGEMETFFAAGRSFGRLDVALNGVFGVETGGESGKDVEAKVFALYRVTNSVRAGFDSRLQAEVSDEEHPTRPALGRDYDLTAGPALSWLLREGFQLQALAGVAQPKKTNLTAPTAMLSASFDF